ncbi:MAG: protease family protein [Fusobacteriaceae bacterium]|jgi:membrane protease YdiL (CAAX protease family)|nr:protease family protein [Fusobacteriaceae bacterium]
MKIYFNESENQGYNFWILLLFGILVLLSQLVASLVVNFSYPYLSFKNSTFLFALSSFLELLFFLASFYFFVVKVMNLKFSTFRIVRPKGYIYWSVVALLLPASVVIFYLCFIDGNFSIGNKYSIVSYIAFAIKLSVTAGITEELLFRGYLMKIIEVRWNKIVGVIGPSIVFALLHMLKGMDITSVVQLFIGGLIVGIMFSLITLYTQSVWNAVIVHVIWNFMIIGVFSISADGKYRSIFNYVLNSNNYFITGGDYGIEVGAPAIIGYIIVIGLAFIWSRFNSQKSECSRH